MIEDAPTIDNEAPPVPLDTITRGVDHLDAMLVCHVADGHVYAQWLRPGAGVDPKRITAKLGEAYRVAYQAAEALRGAASGAARAPRPGGPLLTVELAGRVLIVVGIRAFVAVFAFGEDAPLGLARLDARRLAGLVAPELPFGAVVRGSDVGASDAGTLGDRSTLVSPMRASDWEDPDREVQTIAFDRQSAHEPRRSAPGADGHDAEGPTVEVESNRAHRVLAYLEEHAPEPHIVKLRVALRAGLSLAALEHPDSLGADAIVLIETAAEDILGIDRAELDLGMRRGQA